MTSAAIAVISCDTVERASNMDSPYRPVIAVGCPVGESYQGSYREMGGGVTATGWLLAGCAALFIDRSIG